MDAKGEDQREIVDRVPTVEAGAAHSAALVRTPLVRTPLVRAALVHTALVHTAAAGVVRATNQHSRRTGRIAAASASAVEAGLNLVSHRHQGGVRHGWASRGHRREWAARAWAGHRHHRGGHHHGWHHGGRGESFARHSMRGHYHFGHHSFARHQSGRRGFARHGFARQERGGRGFHHRRSGGRSFALSRQKPTGIAGHAGTAVAGEMGARARMGRRDGMPANDDAPSRARGSTPPICSRRHQ